MTNISEAKIVLLGPEERDGVESFSLAQHVARGGLPLAFPVFDMNSLVSEPIRQARDVAGRKDTRDARFQVLVHVAPRSMTAVPVLPIHRAPRTKSFHGNRPTRLCEILLVLCSEDNDLSVAGGNS